ncbi:hypothetical protein BJ741DRAFT_594330 [Chytriomyces cf. hyalinus JEL632]|nr:hypothetical protein BJ741DRAFT_594330 [Chytriomyces cf. hyalinus JEL632]
MTMQGSDTRVDSNTDAGRRDQPQPSDRPGTGTDTDTETETEKSNIRSVVDGPNSTSAASERRMLQTLNTDDDSNNDDEDDDYEGGDEVGGHIAYAGESGDAAYTVVSRHVEMHARMPKRTYNSRRTKGAPKERHRCAFCPQFFQRAEHLRRHIKSKHDFHKEFSCDYCPKEFARKDELLRHLRMHERRQDVPAEPYAQPNTTPIPTPPIPPQPTQSRPAAQKKKRISPLPLIVQIPNSQPLIDTKAEVSGSAKTRSSSADSWTQTNLAMTEIPVIFDPTTMEQATVNSMQVNASDHNVELINSLNREIFSPSYVYAQSNHPGLNTLWASGFSPDYRPLTCPIDGCFTEFLNEDTGRLHMNYYHNFDPRFPGIPLPNQLTSPLALLQSPNSGASGTAPPNLSILTADQPTAIPSANSHLTMADLTSASISSANNTAFIASDFSPITYGGEEPNIAYNHWIPSPSVYTLSPTTTDQFASIQLESPVPNTVMDTINYPAFPTITQSQQLSLSPRTAAAYFSHYHQPAQSFSSKQPIEFSQDRIQQRNRTLSVGSGVNFMASSSSSSTMLHGGAEFTPYGRSNSIAHPPFVPSHYSHPTNNIINNNTTTPLTRPPITVPSQHIPSTRQQQQQQQQLDLQMPTFAQLPSQDITPPPPPAPPPGLAPSMIASSNPSALVPPPYAFRRRGSRVMQLIQEEGVQLRPFQVRGPSGPESPSGIVATGGNNSGGSVANAMKAEPSLSGYYLNDTSNPVTELVIKNPLAGSEMLLPSSAAMDEYDDDGLFMAAKKCEP